MNEIATSPVSFATTLGLVVLSLALIPCFARLWRGPSLPDRVVALDIIATLLVGLLTLNAISVAETHPLQVAAVLALVNFVGTVGFSLYIRRKEPS